MTQPQEPWIVADAIVKAYGDAVAIRSLSFTMEAGTRWAITGPSGSGKSTLLYLLGALDRPSGGTLRVGGQTLSDLDPAARAAFRYSTVGFVFQEFHLLEDLTVEENVLLPFVGRPRDRRSHRDRALWLLDQVGVGSHRAQPAGVLSGGEKQRVAVARALVGDPAVLLADEPTGNLDSKNGEAVMELLSELHRAGSTVVMVTHDPRFARHADRTVHLFDGRIVDEATAAEEDIQ